MSFLETGRAQPSRDMILHLADRLEVPLQKRNVLLVAGGYAPVFPQRPLADAALDSARKAVDLVLAGHEPHPALAIDGHWTMVAANRAVTRLIAGVDPLLLRPPVNVKGRFILLGDWLYFIAVGGPPGTEENANMKRFLDSFSVIGN